ncbi:hypothetical protein AGMMS49944_05660 [Spirochaetia bacterium]|nr:hypothetical protein AGMMS49944_05660 [Spirochaetia bacterium]
MLNLTHKSAYNEGLRIFNRKGDKGDEGKKMVTQEQENLAKKNTELVLGGSSSSP